MSSHSQGEIIKVSGPLVVAGGMRDAELFDVVRVSDKNLIGEIIEMHGDQASIQVYEETAGLGPGEKVVSESAPLSVELAPGLIGGMFDGIQRPLQRMVEISGNNITRGISVTSLDRSQTWSYVPVKDVGETVETGDIIGYVQETSLIRHHIMVPHGVAGSLESNNAGDYTVEDVVASVKLADGTTRELTMMQKWPVRRARPYKTKIMPDRPLITGQRSIDTFFRSPAAAPRPFPVRSAAGKTVVQHQLANGRKPTSSSISAAVNVAMR